MCVMEKLGSVGVRELRQNLSVYLREIERGKSFEVTDRGQPVAMLVPLPRAATPLQKLIASGRASAPAGDLLELGAPKGRASTAASAALAQEREERGRPPRRSP
jgi:prevent-host-death family protein